MEPRKRAAWHGVGTLGRPLPPQTAGSSSVRSGVRGRDRRGPFRLRSCRSVTFQEQPAAPRRTRVLPRAPGSAGIVSASQGGRPERGPAPHHPRLLTAPGPGGRAALAHDAGELLLPCLPDSPEGHQVGGTHRRKLRRRHRPGGRHGAWNVPWDRQRASSPPSQAGGLGHVCVSHAHPLAAFCPSTLGLPGGIF